MMTCRVCGQPISTDRLNAQPRAVTCSATCRTADQKELRRQVAARRRQELKGKRNDQGK